MANSDAELIQRTLDGDDTAFGFLVDKYKGAVHALAYRKTGNFHTAEDITQDTFLRAYQKLHTLKDWRHFPGWLYRIASRLCLMWHRNRRVVPQPLETVDSGHMDALAWVKHTDQKTRQSVRDGLEALPESQRTVLTLHYLGGMTCEEIARFIGTSRGAVLDRLYRARLQLKKEMIPMMEKTLGAFQLPPAFTQQTMNRIHHTPITATPQSKPLVPWIAVTATLVLALLFGLGQQSMTRFQQPYSLDAPETAHQVEIIDAPIVAILETKPDLVNRRGQLNSQEDKNSIGQDGAAPAEMADGEMSLSKPGFAVFTTSLADRIATWNLLAAKDQTFPVVMVDTVEEAISTSAEVLILRMDHTSLSQVYSEETIYALQRRKIIAVGDGAAQLFDKLGLEIHRSACMSSTDHSPRIQIETNKLIKESGLRTAFVAFNVPSDALQSYRPTGTPPGVLYPDALYADFNFAMHIPRKSHLNSVVDVIARWAGNDGSKNYVPQNYAPIVRQGNHIMIGLDAPTETWTPAYRQLFRDIAVALHAREQEPFKKASWEITKPGTYTITLPHRLSTDKLSGQTFYFQFTQPTTFKAHLEHDGSDNVALLFMGENGTHWTRQDADQGQPLEIKLNITETDIRHIGDRYWNLKVKNFDSENMADGVLTITY